MICPAGGGTVHFFLQRWTPTGGAIVAAMLAKRHHALEISDAPVWEENK